MWSLWQSKIYLWNAASLLSRNYVNNGVKWVSVGQRVVRLQAVKLLGSRTQTRPNACGSNPAGKENFFKSTTLTPCNFVALWPRETHSTSMERSWPFCSAIFCSRDWPYFKDRSCSVKVTPFTHGLTYKNIRFIWHKCIKFHITVGSYHISCWIP